MGLSGLAVDRCFPTEPLAEILHEISVLQIVRLYLLESSLSHFDLLLHMALIAPCVRMGGVIRAGRMTAEITIPWVSLHTVLPSYSAPRGRL